MKTVKSFWTVWNSDVKEMDKNNEELVLEVELKNPLANIFQGTRGVKTGRLISV